MLCRCSQHPGFHFREIIRMNLTPGSCYPLVFPNCSPLARKFWCHVLTSFLVSVWRYSIFRSHITRALGVHGTMGLRYWKEHNIVCCCVDWLMVGVGEEIVWKLLKLWLYVDCEWLDYTSGYTLFKQMLLHRASTHTSLSIVGSVPSILLLDSSRMANSEIVSVPQITWRRWCDGLGKLRNTQVRLGGVPNKTRNLDLLI
jgi:hypothetical protein